MAGILLLEGGAEFQGSMADADLAALSMMRKTDVNICILPTAAAYDDHHLTAGNNGVKWFNFLGYKNVQVVPVTDSKSADDQTNAHQIESADVIFILGGSPHYLADVLNGSCCSQSLQHAYASGKLICGSSAGAMVLCDYYYNPEDKRIYKGVGLVRDTVIIPHHEKFWRSWLHRIRDQLASLTILGIDEQTGMLWYKTTSSWQVYGRGNITVYPCQGAAQIFSQGQKFSY